jgi:hypothetical protein
MRRKFHSREAYVGGIKKFGPTVVNIKDVEAVIYLYADSGKPCALAFAGKSQKPSIYLRFASPERRESYVTEWVNQLRKRAEEMAQRRADRKAFRHSFKVDDILHYSWGYDQTNPEFHQVVAVDEFSVTLRQIALESTGTPHGASGMSDQVVAVKDHFVGEPFKKRPQRGYQDKGPGVVSMKYGCATLWDGKSCYRSWYA